MGFTSPTPALMTEEDAERTLTIGSSHFINLSSASRVCSKFAARERRIVRVSAGELQACNWAIKRKSEKAFLRFLFIPFQRGFKDGLQIGRREA